MITGGRFSRFEPFSPFRTALSTEGYYSLWQGKEGKTRLKGNHKWSHRVLPILGRGLGGGCTEELQFKSDSQDEVELYGESKR